MNHDDRELQVLRAIQAGNTVEEIAEALGCSMQTVYRVYRHARGKGGKRVFNRQRRIKEEATRSSRGHN